MSIVRKANRDRFVVVDKDAALDKRISGKAFGWLVRVLAKPDDWSISIRQFASEYDEGITKVMSAFKELENAGYLIRRRLQDEAGRLYWEQVVYESPEAAAEALRQQEEEQRKNDEEKPCAENPHMDHDQPRLGFPNMDDPNTENPNTGSPATENPTTTKEGSTNHSQTEDGTTKTTLAADGGISWTNELTDHESGILSGVFLAPRPAEATDDEWLVWLCWLANARRARPAEFILTTGRGSRLAAIRAAKRQGYSYDDLRDACRGWVWDAWDGRADQNDLTILLRLSGNLDNFRNWHRHPESRPRRTVTSNGQTNGRHDPNETWVGVRTGDEVEA